MTDTPVSRVALDPQEQPILDELLAIRDRLFLLKSDKTKYVKSCDVNTLYKQVIVQVEKLNDIRTTKPEEENQLDLVLDDSLQLISLFFMTVGRNNEAPAAYSLVSTIKRLLEHLKEAGFFSRKDLEDITKKLSSISEAADRDHDLHCKHILTLIQSRIAICRTLVAELEQVVSQLSPELAPTFEKLVSILRSLSGLNARKNFPVDEVKAFQRQIEAISEEFQGPKALITTEGMSATERLEKYADKIRHMSYDQAASLPGEALVRDLIERDSLWAEIMMERKGRIDEKFLDTYNELLSIKTKLDTLSLTQAWSLRETDLYSYQRKLDKIDGSRVDGQFLDADGNPSELFEQRTFLYLIRKSYVNIYLMLTASEPVSEALLPIYNQLTTLRKCLKEVKKSGGVSSPRELYPYSMKLNSIDNMRQDGKFVVNGDIPEGQASVVELLSECFEMAYDLRNESMNQPEDEGTEHKDITKTDDVETKHQVTEKNAVTYGSATAISEGIKT